MPTDEKMAKHQFILMKSLHFINIFNDDDAQMMMPIDEDGDA